jgi:hypothetical protein
MNLHNSKYRVLGFDPGEITGISLLIDNRFVWGMAATPEAFNSDNFFPSLVKISNPTDIVVEIPPTQGRLYNKPQSDVYYAITKWFETAGYKVHIVSPGMWKHLVERSQIDSGHIRDAADMSKWFFNKEVGMHHVR